MLLLKLNKTRLMDKINKKPLNIGNYNPMFFACYYFVKIQFCATIIFGLNKGILS